MDQHFFECREYTECRECTECIFSTFNVLLKRKIKLQTHVPSHVVDSMIWPRVGWIGFEIFQPAQMILVGDVENIIRE